jgi:peroxiredoxin
VFLLPLQVFSAVTIQCNNPKYASKKLVFYSYSDPVSQQTTPVFTLETDGNGKTSKSVEIATVKFVFCDFGIYRGMLFLEPGQTITLKLPPVREKTFADEKNPYFKPVTFWFETENAPQLNNQVARFTARLNLLTDQYFDPLYFRQSKPYLDSLKIGVEKEFGTLKNEYFVLNKQLALKQVEVDVFRLKPENYANIFNDIKPVYWQFPAFTDLFEKAFSGLLSFDAKTVGGDNLKKAVNQGNTQALLDHLKNKYKVTGEMADLALLKMLHDAWYSGDFSKTQVQQMIKSARFSGHQNPVIRETAKNITEKISFLQSGSAAPAICLKNMEGAKICTSTTKGKYKYILFADTEMAVSREHLKYLSAVEQKFQKNLEIFIILRKTEPAALKKFFTENQVPGVKLIDENGEFTQLYKIRSFPQCFLLDENHRVKLAPAKAPLDGFEQQFGSILQNDRIENLRKQGK